MSMLRAVIAIDQQGAIGLEGKLPWHLPSELKHFKQLTMGGTLLWGATTFRNIGKPLKGRAHLVVSRQSAQEATSFELPMDPQNTSVHWFNDVKEAIHFFEKNKINTNLWLCGGASMYEQLAPLVKEWHVTEIMSVVAADCYLKTKPWDRGFKIINEQMGPDTKESGELFPWRYRCFQRE